MDRVDEQIADDFIEEDAERAVCGRIECPEDTEATKTVADVDVDLEEIVRQADAPERRIDVEQRRVENLRSDLCMVRVKETDTGGHGDVAAGDIGFDIAFREAARIENASRRIEQHIRRSRLDALDAHVAGLFAQGDVAVGHHIDIAVSGNFGDSEDIDRRCAGIGICCSDDDIATAGDRSGLEAGQSPIAGSRIDATEVVGGSDRRVAGSENAAAQLFRKAAVRPEEIVMGDTGCLARRLDEHAARGACAALLEARL
ncbi:hypothetical protein D9M68_362780 [compost metagenome]